MPRRKKIDRGMPFKVYLPHSIESALREELYSEIEGKVPFGALTNLTTELFTEWLRSRGRNV